MEGLYLFQIKTDLRVLKAQGCKTFLVVSPPAFPTENGKVILSTSNTDEAYKLCELRYAKGEYCFVKGVYEDGRQVYALL